MLTKDVVKIQALPCPKPSGYDPLNPFPHTQNPPKTVFARFEPLPSVSAQEDFLFSVS